MDKPETKQENQSAHLTSELQEATKEWTLEDQKWLHTVKPELRTIAARHGRALFIISMRAGQAQFALTTLFENTRHPQLKMMISQVTGMMDAFCKEALAGQKLTPKDLRECQEDIERLAAIKSGATPEGANVSPGGIILNS